MNPLSHFLQPAVRRGPRYSVRPFYATILIFTALVVLSWTVSVVGNGPARQRTTAGVSLFKRVEETEVPHPCPCEMEQKLKDSLSDLI